jgi:hypothetical protein
VQLAASRCSFAFSCIRFDFELFSFLKAEFMSIVEAKCTATESVFHVEGYEKIEFDLQLIDRLFEIENSNLADSYRSFGSLFSRRRSQRQSTLRPANAGIFSALRH